MFFFFHGDLNEEVYKTIPLGFQPLKPNQVSNDLVLGSKILCLDLLQKLRIKHLQLMIFIFLCHNLTLDILTINQPFRLPTTQCFINCNL
ncbi:hypothetical protein CR513_42713, partial [Mucuna pruriens]